MEIVEVLRIPSIDSFSRGWGIIGSSNGLLCVELDTDKDRFPISLCLWNPVRNEVREVPEPLYDYANTCRVGFGYSSLVDDYKIVRFYNRNCLRKDSGKYNCSKWLNCGQVYSLRTGSWKELEMEHIRRRAQLFTEATTCVNGTIFWLGGAMFYEMLVAFDIATEVFTLTPMHTLSLNVDIRKLVRCSPFLYMLGNKLAMCEDFFGGELSKPYSFHIWVIEECAGESGKSYNCTETYRIEPNSNFLIDLGIWRNEIVCLYEKSEAEAEVDQRNFLYMFNLTTKEWKKFPCFSPAYCCDIFNYEMSLASVCVCCNTVVD